MNNIEKFKVLREIQAKKSELHKANLLALFDWTSPSEAVQEPIEKAVKYSEIGLMIVQLLKNANLNASQTTEE